MKTYGIGCFNGVPFAIFLSANSDDPHCLRSMTKWPIPKFGTESTHYLPHFDSMLFTNMHIYSFHLRTHFQKKSLAGNYSMHHLLISVLGSVRPHRFRSPSTLPLTTQPLFAQSCNSQSNSWVFRLVGNCRQYLQNKRIENENNLNTISGRTWHLSPKSWMFMWGVRSRSNVYSFNLKLLLASLQFSSWFDTDAIGFSLS